MKSLHFLIGLPRSGKSTLADRWLNGAIRILGNNMIIESDPGLSVRPRVVVCADKIRLACGHRWNSFVEPYVNSVKETMIRTLLYDHDVLIDGTHTTEHSIVNTLKFQPGASWCFINASQEDCKARAAQTNQLDLFPVIDRMYYQLLDLCDCSWEQIPDRLPSKIETLRQRALEYQKLERIDD